MLNYNQKCSNAAALQCCDKKLKTSLRAFSLIEMSLVLAIMGTVAGLSMPLLLEQRTLQKQQKTQQHMDIVLTALGTYAASNGVLPCPASLMSQGEPLKSSSDSQRALVGFLPYKALGIKESSSKDGFGHPLRYALDPSLSVVNTFRERHDPYIFIKGPNGESLFRNIPNNDLLAVVIVGENQAYQDANSALERANIDQSSTFIDAPFSTKKSNLFRQNVQWSTRNNLLTRYGKSTPIVPPTNGNNTTQSAQESGPDVGLP